MSEKRGMASLHVWLPVMVLVVAALILYAPFVFGGKTLFWGTPLLQFWPWRQFAAQQLRSVRLPLWNPYAGNGLPLLADHQTAVFYPLNLLFWIGPVERAMGWSLALHAIVAGVTMYALTRELGISRLGGLVSALAFMCSGYMVSRGAFLTEISALPWLPLLWLYGRRVILWRRVRDIVAMAVIVAVQFLAGHAQTWFYSMISVALYGLWVWWAGHRLEKRRWSSSLFALVKGYLLLLVAVLLGIALAGAQFVPTFELSLLAGRAGREGWETFALQYSMWPWRLITLLLPNFFGHPMDGTYWGYATYWEDAGYIGVLPFFFALLAISYRIRIGSRGGRRAAILGHVPAFVFLAIVALVMALGKNTPFYLFFFRHVPGFDMFQAPARWLCVYTPAVALLSGIGIDVLRPSHRLRFVSRLGVAGALGMAVTALVAKRFFDQVEVTFFGPMIFFALFLAASLLLLLWGLRRRAGTGVRIGTFSVPGWVWPAALTSCVALDLLLVGYGQNPAISQALYAPQTEIGRFLSDDGPQGRTFFLADTRKEVMWERYLDFGDYGTSDVSFWLEMRETLLPDLGMPERLPSANSFEPLVEARYFSLLERVNELDQEAKLRVLGVMNVAYVLDDGPALGLEPIYSGAVDVYRNPHVLPRAYVACRAIVADSPKDALRLLSGPDFDPATTVILERDVGSDARSAVQSCKGGTATLLPSGPNQAKIRAVLPQPGYLVLVDTYYPGWEARVDGRRADILRANYAFRAVALEAGEHEVVFVYRAPAFAAGVAGSVVAAVVLIALAIWLWRWAVP